MAAIELATSVKRFGAIRAVDGLDLEVPEGICLGLLGPNGAGKSTTMRLLTGQAIADSGELRVLELRAARRSEGRPGRDGRRTPARQPRRRRHGRGQPRGLRPPLPGRRRRRGGRPGARAGAPRRRAATMRSTSSPGGMRRRLLLARGPRPRPRLLLLDEPTVGLDPQIRTELWSLIDGLRTEGTTILMSTHYIEEAERLADEVAVMAAGKVDRPRAPGGADRRARRARDGGGLRAARPARRGPRAGRGRGAHGRARPARRSRSSAPSAPPTASSPRTRSAGRPRSRTSSSC